MATWSEWSSRDEMGYGAACEGGGGRFDGREQRRSDRHDASRPRRCFWECRSTCKWKRPGADLSAPNRARSSCAAPREALCGRPKSGRHAKNPRSGRQPGDGSDAVNENGGTGGSARRAVFAEPTEDARPAADADDPPLYRGVLLLVAGHPRGRCKSSTCCSRSGINLVRSLNPADRSAIAYDRAESSISTITSREIGKELFFFFFFFPLRSA